MQYAVPWSLLLVYLLLPGLSSMGAEPASKPGDDKRPHVVLVSWDDEYRSAQTLPRFGQQLTDRFGYQHTFLRGEPKEGIRGLEALATADALVLFVRRKSLPEEQMARIRGYVESGKPLVALRTSSHAFAVGNMPDGWERWPELDREVLGGSYHGHCGSGPPTVVSVAPGAAEHAIVAGFPKTWDTKGALYRVSPVNKDAAILLMGTYKDVTEPVAWARPYRGGRVFYTSLGHPDDFQSPPFVTLLINALHWAMNKPVPAGK